MSGEAIINKNGGSAFPWDDKGGCAETGMSLRDWFAGKIIVGMIERGLVGPDLNSAAVTTYNLAQELVCEGIKRDEEDE